MEITLKMNIQDHEFELKANLTMKAGRIYRQQFNRDLSEDLMSLYKKNTGSVFDNIDYSKIDVDSQTDEEIQNELVRQALPIYFRNRRESALTYSDTEQACQIIWAFVKNADDTTPVYTEWIDGFDFVLPIKDLINILYNAWNETARPTVEVKN